MKHSLSALCLLLSLAVACSAPNERPVLDSNSDAPSLAPSATIEVAGPPSLDAGGTFLGQPFRLMNTGGVPLTYWSYGPPVDGFVSPTPAMVRVLPEGERRYPVGWCGTGLEPYTLAPGDSVQFQSGMHLDPDAGGIAYRVELTLRDPAGESLVVSSPVVQ